MIFLKCYTLMALKNPYELQITAVRRITILLPWVKVNCLQPFTFTSFSLSNTLRLPVNKSGATLSKTYIFYKRRKEMHERRRADVIALLPSQRKKINNEPRKYSNILGMVTLNHFEVHKTRLISICCVWPG